jgi:toxin ParE1/3/4
MNTFILTNAAIRDLKDIASFTEKRWGKSKRNSYLRQLNDSFHLISESPEIGKSCDYIKYGYRKIQSNSHIIFYKIKLDKSVEIIRILHERMNIEESQL